LLEEFERIVGGTPSKNLVFSIRFLLPFLPGNPYFYFGVWYCTNLKQLIFQGVNSKHEEGSNNSILMICENSNKLTSSTG